MCSREVATTIKLRSRSLLLSRAERRFSDAGRRRAPSESAHEWTSQNGSDLGLAIVELLAYLADVLDAYQALLAAEARLATRRRYALMLTVTALLLVSTNRRRRCGEEQRQ